MKGFTFLLLAALAAVLAPQSAAAHLPDLDQAGPVFGNRKIQVGRAFTLTVGHPAAVAVPLTFNAGDYRGPYDPLDPKGILAAKHRRSKMEGQMRKENIKSFVPPETGTVVRKGVKKLALDEGRRFAFAHPKETAEIVGIATKAKALYNTANRRLADLDKKQGLLGRL